MIRLVHRCAVLAFCMLLTSCWLPDQFEAEIRFTSTGAYGITYIGNLIYAPLWGQIARKEIEKADTDRQVLQFFNYLKQDSKYFKEVNSLGKGKYQVRYEREGQFAGSHQMVTFVNRQGAIFRLRTTEEGTVTLGGSGQGLLYADKFTQVGLTMQGLIRVVTDAEVTQHNATSVRASPTPGFTIYDWRIRGFKDPPPRLIAKLKVDPRTGVPAFGALGSGVEEDDEPKR